MPTVAGVLETALYVEDLEASARFYNRVFGFQVIDSGTRLVAMGVPGPGVLLLFKKGASAHLPVSAHDGSGTSHLAFAVAAAELDRWLTWLPQQGIAIEEDRTWPRGGRSLYFRDPDQHLIEIATPGVWSVY